MGHISWIGESIIYLRGFWQCVSSNNELIIILITECDILCEKMSLSIATYYGTKEVFICPNRIKSKTKKRIFKKVVINEERQ